MSTERKDGTRRSLRDDERGAIMVIGLFASIFLVGILFYVLGFGQALRHGERLQDAADATTFSVAVMHARAMNLIALLNMVKLGVTVVLASYLAITIAVERTVSWITGMNPCVYCASLGALAAILSQAQAAYSGAAARGNRILTAAERAQETLRERLPDLAVERARADVLPGYKQPAQDLFAWPEMQPLPTERGSPDELCDRATSYSEDIGDQAFRTVPQAEPRSRALSEYGDAFDQLCPTFTAPARISDPELGGERYQLRLFVTSRPLSGVGEEGVRVGAFFADDGAGRVGKLRDELSRLSFAQAEYYFEGPQEEAEMLWHMQWRARLRRFRFPGGQMPPELSILRQGGSGEWVVH